MVASRLARFFIIAMAGITGVFFAADQFIVKKAKKEPSIGALKEECCQQLVDAVKQVPHVLLQVAVFQQHAIEIIQGYWHSDKESFCQQAAKEKLVRCAAQLKELDAKTEALLAQYKKVMRELELSPVRPELVEGSQIFKIN